MYTDNLIKDKIKVTASCDLLMHMSVCLIARCGCFLGKLQNIYLVNNALNKLGNASYGAAINVQYY